MVGFFLFHSVGLSLCVATELFCDIVFKSLALESLISKSK